QLPALASGADGDRSPDGHGLTGVLEDVEERLAEQLLVRPDGRQGGIQLPVEMDAAGVPLGLQEGRHAAEQRVEIERLERQLLGPHEPQESLDHSIQPLDLAPYDVQALLHV